MWIINFGRQRSWWGGKNKSISDFSMLCLCWILNMWFLEAMSRWTSYWEITSRVKCPYGIRKDRMCLLLCKGTRVAHRVHLPAQTCGSMFIDLDLCYYGLLAYNFPQRKCLLLCSQFHPTAWLFRNIHSSHCYQTLAVLFPWVGWCLGTAFVFRMFSIVPFFLLWKEWNIEEFGEFSS